MEWTPMLNNTRMRIYTFFGGVIDFIVACIKTIKDNKRRAMIKTLWFVFIPEMNSQEQKLKVLDIDRPSPLPYITQTIQRKLG